MENNNYNLELTKYIWSILKNRLQYSCPGVLNLKA